MSNSTHPPSDTSRARRPGRHAGSRAEARQAAPWLTTAAARAADRATIEAFGLPSFTLMESAAHGVVETLFQRMERPETASYVVLAGAGNNGGDGLAVARLLHGRGVRVTVALVESGSRTADNAANLALLESLLASPVQVANEDLSILRANEGSVRDTLEQLDGLGPFDVCVDGLVGVGCRGALREPIRSLARWSRKAGSTVAIDVPSGLDSDSGECDEAATPRCDLTVTMIGPKLGLALGNGPAVAGEVVLAHIGVPRHVLREAARMPGCAYVAGHGFVRAVLPPRDLASHKYSAGQVAVIAGSDEYAGAAVLASEAARAVGAGYVLCATTARAAAAIDARCPAVAAFARDEDERPDELIARARRARAWLVGPGVGRSEATQAWLRRLMPLIPAPLVVDADALFAVAGEGALEALVAAREHPTVLTPHAGEFRRLVEGARASDEFAPSRPVTTIARAFAERFGVVLVLKGAPTVVAAPDGTTYAEPGLGVLSGGSHDEGFAFATAGTGDVLAGMIAGCIAQGASSLDAAVASLRLGCDAARHWTKRRSARSLSADALVERVPEALHRALHGPEARLP